MVEQPVEEARSQAGRAELAGVAALRVETGAHATRILFDGLRARGVAYAVVTGAIADRVLAARDRYPRETRFYLDLRRSARRLYYVAPGRGLAGPWVAVYRL